MNMGNKVFKDAKSINQWFEQAKSQGYEWADAAIENHKNLGIFDGMGEGGDICCLSDAVLYGFDWRRCKNGYDFWDKIHDSLLEKKL